jgi:hypothetical protein
MKDIYEKIIIYIYIYIYIYTHTPLNIIAYTTTYERIKIFLTFIYYIYFLFVNMTCFKWFLCYFFK